MKAHHRIAAALTIGVASVAPASSALAPGSPPMALRNPRPVVKATSSLTLPSIRRTSIAVSPSDATREEKTAAWLILLLREGRGVR
jgi:hypothetical protein